MKKKKVEPRREPQEDPALAAERAHDEALKAYRTAGDKAGIAETLEALGDLYYDTERPSEALVALEEALSIYRALGDDAGTADTLQSLGNLSADKGDLEAAWDQFINAFRLHRGVDMQGSAADHIYLGRIANRLGHSDQAILLAGYAWLILRQIEVSAGQELALSILYSAYVRKREVYSDLCAMALLWEALRLNGDPRRVSCEETLGKAFPGFNPKRPLLARIKKEAVDWIQTSFTALETSFDEGGHNVYFFPSTP